MTHRRGVGLERWGLQVPAQVCTSELWVIYVGMWIQMNEQAMEISAIFFFLLQSYFIVNIKTCWYLLRLGSSLTRIALKICCIPSSCEFQRSTDAECCLTATEASSRGIWVWVTSFWSAGLCHR